MEVKNRKLYAGRGVSLLLGWRECGSYTVEAAFIVPIVLGLVFVVLYMTFLLHDKVVLQANLDNLIFLLAEGEEVDGREYEEYLSRALWITGLQDVEVKDGALEVRGKAAGSAYVDIPVISLFMSGKQESSFSESFYKIQPEEVMRYGSDIFRRGDGEAKGE